MKSLFKLVFGIIGAVFITAMTFGVTLIVGHAVTGSWNIGEWNKIKPAATVVTEYEIIPE